MSNYNTKNYTEQGGDVTHIGGKLVLEAGAVIEGEGAADLAAVATETTLGGVKAAAAGASETVEVKIGADGKMYVPALALPTEAALGGILAAAAGVGDTVEVKVGEDGKAYVPAYPGAPAPASAEAAGTVYLAQNIVPLAADADAAAIVTRFNGLLLALKAADIMAPDPDV